MHKTQRVGDAGTRRAIYYEYIHIYIYNRKFPLYIYNVYVHMLICYNSVYTLYFDVHKTQRVEKGRELESYMYKCICINIL